MLFPNDNIDGLLHYQLWGTLQINLNSAKNTSKSPIMKKIFELNILMLDVDEFKRPDCIEILRIIKSIFN